MNVLRNGREFLRRNKSKTNLRRMIFLGISDNRELYKIIIGNNLKIVYSCGCDRFRRIVGVRRGGFGVPIEVGKTKRMNST